MKRIVFINFILLVFYVTDSWAQLPPVAQALYDEAYAAEPAKAQNALNLGAQVIATPDGNSFYLKWFPTGSTPAATPLIVTLHGSGSYVFNGFDAWDSLAQVHGCGVVALQWYRGTSTSPPNDYFNETQLYSYIDSALTKIGYPSGKALLHGFSRGSARSYAVVFKDSHGGKNYFCTTMSNAGGADSTYPLYAQIDSGNFGSNVFMGKHWALFCGGQDPDPSLSGCPAMSYTQSWLQAQGATVDLFIQDPSLGHGGFHLTPVYVDSLLKYYLQCFNGTLSVNEHQKDASISVYPNPSTAEFNIRSSGYNIEKVDIYDVYGHLVMQKILHANLGTFNFREANSGIYFLHIHKGDGTTVFRKVVRN